MAIALGCARWPILDVVYLGSRPDIITPCSILRKASITTLPLTDWMGSTTIATALGFKFSCYFWVSISVPESQGPKPGWEWYQPTTFCSRPTCFIFSMNSCWKTGSTDSTETVVPIYGIEKTSITVIVYSSTISPTMRPIIAPCNMFALAPSILFLSLCHFLANLVELSKGIKFLVNFSYRKIL